VRKVDKVLRKILLWALFISVPLAVFVLYTRPNMLVMLADQLWACF
jgi:hypothetical protein